MWLKICNKCGDEFKSERFSGDYCKNCKKDKIIINSNYYQMRFAILRRDSFTCQYCGRTPSDNIKLQVDHIHPKSRGGEAIENNLITSCDICNLGKSDVLLEQHEEKKLLQKINKNKAPR